MPVIVRSARRSHLQAQGRRTLHHQANVLRLLRCDEMQRYVFSKPLPLEELTPTLKAKV
jgi:hypothetical protein